MVDRGPPSNTKFIYSAKTVGTDQQNRINHEKVIVVHQLQNVIRLMRPVSGDVFKWLQKRNDIKLPF